MFVFVLPAEAADALASAMEGFPFRGPVHDRIIEQLRSPGDHGEVKCQLSQADNTVLDLWSTHPDYADAPWQADLADALADGASF